MNDVIDFETYLIISHKKFEIHLLDIKNFKNLYKREFDYETDLEKIDLNLLSEFLEKNIFRIEKIAGNFVNHINVIIENNSNLNFNLSVKKKNYSGNITNTILEKILSDVKDLFQESYNHHKLVHMAINKYIIKGISYSSLLDNINSDEIVLEIKLISISKLIIYEIESNLKKYQIQVNNYLDKGYVNNYFKEEEELDISLKAHKLLNGLNINEVRITSKSSEKLGFFEKFFQLFS
ncbi:hypothetical protein [Candidatus Pelagibacter communis]|uniref:hypothetical protein n=1 Tax=Pelagibacter ubique TaxID=198252 RepID=UPI00094DAEDB|nr:hypothetical protein [Candidatus Pelagibacter ubique]